MSWEGQRTEVVVGGKREGGGLMGMLHKGRTRREEGWDGVCTH